ncbi:MAG: topoisomerase [Paenibacillus sp.]|nr:topoisomerase [Paenibacillus sp.]
MARALLRKPLAVTKRFVDDAKVSDHHAIIPTEQVLHLGALSPEERKLYDLIVRRFISLFYPASLYDETSLVVRCGDDRFYAKGYVQKEAGWKAVYEGTAAYTSGQAGEDDDERDGDEAQQAGEGKSAAHLPSQSLPALTEGQPLPVKSLRSGDHQTKPPGRHTEASLLSGMEKHNLGTPATRADIIEKLLHTDTIERRQNQLIPTGKGKQLIELTAAALRTPDLTAEWERELEAIAKGKGDPKAFIDSIRVRTAAFVAEVKASDQEYKHHNLTHSKCPDCGRNMIESNGKRGKMLVCPSRECGFRRAAEPALTNKRCPQCHKRMEIHDGKAGKYFQCRSCNVIEKLDGQASGGGKANRKQQAQLAKQFSDNVSLGSSLGDALKAAMQRNEQD